MLALPNGGTPTTQLIGTDPNNLAWTVDQPIGEELMLTVIDGNGNPGGVPPGLFTVIAGQTTSCLSQPTSDLGVFNVTANVTTTLTTCQPWGIRVIGGVPPYNVTLAALNSPVITNVTIGLGDDVFTYIDRADPGTQLIAAVSDFQGRWASGTPLVTTQGSTDVDCIGLVSSTGNSTEMAASNSNGSSSHRPIIIGVCAALAALLLIGGGVIGFIFWKRRQAQQDIEDGQDLEPRQFFDAPGNPGQVVSMNSFITAHPTSPKSNRPMSEMQNFNPYDTPVTTTAPSDFTSASSSSQTGPLRERPSFANFPSSSIRSNKAIEAGYARPQDAAYLTATASAPDIAGPSEPSGTLLSTTSGSVWSGPSTTTHTGAVDAIQTHDGEVIFQHRDAGLPRELPPPYADRTIPPP
ncbi:hypothetical protein BDN72DRAFT_456026 [Pluteus cervinus]|uniref:Uncharacterized protein n=1 Tax=Pluteus cervinus TaxID=181527 RepID=A0ACD3AZH2_9AGAR|nr:hypothetical protein BDN72DRAFT_456026 [Pluteus cervinus]